MASESSDGPAIVVLRLGTLVETSEHPMRKPTERGPSKEMRS